MFPRSITAVTLGVADLARSQAFYARLGWEAGEAQEGVAFIHLAGQMLCLFGIEDLAKDQGRERAGLGTGAMTLARNFGSEAEVDAACALAIEAGGSTIKRPEKVFWGGYSGYFADPDGHVWELAMNPFWGIGEDGRVAPGRTG